MVLIQPFFLKGMHKERWLKVSWATKNSKVEGKDVMIALVKSMGMLLYLSKKMSPMLQGYD